MNDETTLEENVSSLVSDQRLWRGIQDVCLDSLQHMRKIRKDLYVDLLQRTQFKETSLRFVSRENVFLALRILDDDQIQEYFAWTITDTFLNLKMNRLPQILNRFCQPLPSHHPGKQSCLNERFFLCVHQLLLDPDTRYAFFTEVLNTMWYDSRAPTLGPAAFEPIRQTPQPPISISIPFAAPNADFDGDEHNCPQSISVPFAAAPNQDSNGAVFTVPHKYHIEDRNLCLVIMLLERFKKAGIDPKINEFPCFENVTALFSALYYKNPLKVERETLVHDLKTTRLGKLAWRMCDRHQIPLPEKFFSDLFMKFGPSSLPPDFSKLFVAKNFTKLARRVLNYAYTFQHQSTNLMEELMNCIVISDDSSDSEVSFDGRRIIPELVVSDDSDDSEVDERSRAELFIAALTPAELRWFLFESGHSDALISDGSLDMVKLHNLFFPPPQTTARITPHLFKVIQEHPTFYKDILNKTDLGTVSDFQAKIAAAYNQSILPPPPSSSSVCSSSYSAASSSSSSDCSSSTATSSIAGSRTQAQGKRLECTICFEVFDNNIRKPCIFRACGHGVCQICAQKAVHVFHKCFTCEHKLAEKWEDAVLINYMLLEYVS